MWRGESTISRDLTRIDLKFISTRSIKQRITFPVSVEQTANWNSLLDSIIQERVHSILQQINQKADLTNRQAHIQTTTSSITIVRTKQHFSFRIFFILTIDCFNSCCVFSVRSAVVSILEMTIYTNFSVHLLESNRSFPPDHQLIKLNRRKAAVTPSCCFESFAFP